MPAGHPIAPGSSFAAPLLDSHRAAPAPKRPNQVRLSARAAHGRAYASRITPPDCAPCFMRGFKLRAYARFAISHAIACHPRCAPRRPPWFSALDSCLPFQFCAFLPRVRGIFHGPTPVAMLLHPTITQLVPSSAIPLRTPCAPQAACARAPHCAVRTWTVGTSSQFCPATNGFALTGLTRHAVTAPLGSAGRLILPAARFHALWVLAVAAPHTFLFCLLHCRFAGLTVRLEPYRTQARRTAPAVPGPPRHRPWDAVLLPLTILRAPGFAQVSSLRDFLPPPLACPCWNPPGRITLPRFTCRAAPNITLLLVAAAAQSLCALGFRLSFLRTVPFLAPACRLRDLNTAARAPAHSYAGCTVWTARSGRSILALGCGLLVLCVLL